MESKGLYYGLQPPEIRPQDLTTVIDLEDQMRGPAMFFSTTYDKVVILKSEDLMEETNPSKRDVRYTYGYDEGRVNSGETPWYCFWNDTTIETYLYMLPIDTDNFTYEVGTSPVTKSESPGVAASAPSSSYDQENRPNRMKPYDDTGSDVGPPVYPGIAKIEERVLRSSGQKSYCQRMNVEDGGKVIPFIDTNGEIVVRNVEGTSVEKLSSRLRYRNVQSTLDSTHSPQLVKKDSPSNYCNCEWVNG